MTAKKLKKTILENIKKWGELGGGVGYFPISYTREGNTLNTMSLEDKLSCGWPAVVLAVGSTGEIDNMYIKVDNCQTKIQELWSDQFGGNYYVRLANKSGRKKLTEFFANMDEEVLNRIM